MKLGLIYLASGFSRRFGGNKLLASFQGAPLFTYGLKHLQEAAAQLTPQVACTVRVITQYEEIIQYCKECDIDVCFNGQAQEGMAASIRLGVRQGKDQDGWAFFAADQPFLDSQTIASFLQDFKDSGKTLGTVTTGMRQGSPAVFLSMHREELLALQGDIGGRNILRRYQEKVYRFSVPDAKLIDIDTTDTLQKHNF